MSQAALDVVDVVHADHTNATQAAAAIARDASLAVEVLKLANSSFYNPSGERVVSLEQAVVRIGTRRVGELALAATVLTSLTTCRVKDRRANEGGLVRSCQLSQTSPQER